MGKDKKVFTCNTPKYTFYSDEESDDDDIDYSDLFKGLDINKSNELIDALNEKNKLTKKQEDLIYGEHD
jgi:hypothetical protein